MDRTRITILLFMLAVSGIECKPPLTSGTTPQSYIRLLDTDAPTGAVVMRTSSDGNMLFLYTAKVPGDSVTSIELTKTDVNGNVLWTQHYPATSTDNYAAGDCLSLADGSIAIAGTHGLSGSYDSITFLLVDANGNLALNQGYVREPSLSATSIRQSGRGDFIIGSHGKDTREPGSSTLYFLDLSANGNLMGTANISTNIQYNTYGMNDMSAISGNSGVAAGLYSSGQNSTTLFPAVFQWQYPDTIAFSESFSQWNTTAGFRSIVQTGAASYMVVGDSTPFGNKNYPYYTAWIGEVDAPFTGQVNNSNWSRGINPASTGCIVNVIQTADKGLAATGYFVSASGDTEAAVFRFDSKGNDVWPYKTYDYNGGDIPSNIIELPGGDLIVGGVTTSFGARSSGARQIFLLHLKADGTPAS
jgi:hypothetical protein